MGENPEEQDKMADTLKTDILVERQDKRRLSPGSSTQSKGGARKKTKMGSLDEEESEKDKHEDKEFEDAFEKAPDLFKENDVVSEECSRVTTRFISPRPDRD